MPLVSVIVPCYNEEATICLLLEALYSQTFPRQEMEVVIADGRSSDLTRERIAAFQKDHSDLSIRVVENERRMIPSALNRAITAAQGKWVVRLDGHSIPASNYVALCVEALQAGKGEIVGGRWEIHPRSSSWEARSIALAAGHPLGVGDALYRVGGEAQAVETVPFGAFQKDLVQRIGLYDESLLTNEDYEFNTRARQAGGRVWFDPAIRSRYFAVGSFQALWKQYWRYGFWKAIMLRKYPATIRWRQALPPMFVLSLVGLMVFSWMGFRWARRLLGAELVTYGLVLGGAGVQAARKKKDAGLLAGVPIAIACMHVAWGAAFLWSWIGLKRRG